MDHRAEWHCWASGLRFWQQARVLVWALLIEAFDASDRYAFVLYFHNIYDFISPNICDPGAGFFSSVGYSPPSNFILGWVFSLLGEWAMCASIWWILFLKDFHVIGSRRIKLISSICVSANEWQTNTASTGEEKPPTEQYINLEANNPWDVCWGWTNLPIFCPMLRYTRFRRIWVLVFFLCGMFAVRPVEILFWFMRRLALARASIHMVMWHVGIYQI